MIAARLALPLLAVVVALATAASRPAASQAAPPPAMLPDRTLDCAMRRVTNPDLGHDQPYEALLFEGSSRLVLHLSPVPVRTTPPPEPYETPEATPATTRVTLDEGRLLAGVPVPFSRVVDRWPTRVEIATDIDDRQLNLMILSPIDPGRGTARLFLTFSNYQFGYDPGRIYIGDCTIAIAPE